MCTEKVTGCIVRMIRWLQQRDGFWFPAVRWLLNWLYEKASVGSRVNACFDKRTLGGPWVSEFYQLFWVLLGLFWIAVIDWPVLTSRTWIGLGLFVALYRVFEILLFSVHWLLVAEEPVESFRRSLLAFLLNLCEVSVFFTVTYWLLGCFNNAQGPWSLLFQNLRSVFSLKTALSQCSCYWPYVLPRLQLIIAWILVALIVANLVSAINRGEKAGNKKDTVEPGAGANR